MTHPPDKPEELKETKCSVCGSDVYLSTDKDGTSYYVPRPPSSTGELEAINEEAVVKLLESPELWSGMAGDGTGAGGIAIFKYKQAAKAIVARFGVIRGKEIDPEELILEIHQYANDGIKGDYVYMKDVARLIRAALAKAAPEQKEPDVILSKQKLQHYENYQANWKMAYQLGDCCSGHPNCIHKPYEADQEWLNAPGGEPLPEASRVELIKFIHKIDVSSEGKMIADALLSAFHITKKGEA